MCQDGRALNCASLRRIAAPKRHWKALRDRQKTRSVVLYWNELTVHHMAPGGRAAKRDREAFIEEWTGAAQEEEQ